MEQNVLLMAEPLFVKGFRDLLSLNDLWQTPPDLASEKLRDDMQAAWDRRYK
jgi:ATP-binding cassette subfamily C (CFTR/MRP) protein 1